MSSEAVRIAHISDPHFGSDFHTKGGRLVEGRYVPHPPGYLPPQLVVWRTLLDFLKDTLKPHLVLVSGDIVHTPDKAGYQAAKNELDQLGIKYLVCPGNHDRHWMGNALGRVTPVYERLAGFSGASSWFDASFAQLMPTISAPASVGLPESASTWNLLIVGCDTSINARYTALGYASDGDIRSLPGATTGQDADLVILLHHHHLLSIKELEDRRQTFRDMFRPTVMVNAGTVLEALAQAHVNIVLHGHEHCRAYARYGTVVGQQSDAVIVGAGSCTGNDSLQGCAFERASFNSIELRPDRSVHLQEIRYHQTEGWSPTGASIRLLDAHSIRRSRFYRRTVHAAPPTIKAAACFEFQPDRTVEVTETWENWPVEKSEWRRSTMNSSGSLSRAFVQFDWAGSLPMAFAEVPFARDYEAPGGFIFKVLLKNPPMNVAKRVLLRFRWLGGGVLTDRDCHYLDPDALGEFRRNGHEYVAVKAVGRLQSLSILVRLPPEFAPSPDAVQVMYAQPVGRPESSAELAYNINHHAPGIFSIEITYPRENYNYLLKWPVAPDVPPSAAAAKFQKLGEHADNAKQLLDAFSSGSVNHRLEEPFTLAFYALGANGFHLQKAAELHTGRLGANSRPPASISLRHETAYRNAWWGQKVIGSPAVDSVAPIPDERAFIIVPIRRSEGYFDSAIGIVRIGVFGYAHLDDARLGEYLDSVPLNEAFADAVVSVLQMASSLTGTSP